MGAIEGQEGFSEEWVVQEVVLGHKPRVLGGTLSRLHQETFDPLFSLSGCLQALFQTHPRWCPSFHHHRPPSCPWTADGSPQSPHCLSQTCPQTRRCGLSQPQGHPALPPEHPPVLGALFRSQVIILDSKSFPSVQRLMGIETIP